MMMNSTNKEMGQSILPNIIKKKNRTKLKLADSMIRSRVVEPLCQQQERPLPSMSTSKKTLTRLIARRNWWEIESLLSTEESVESIEIDEKDIITEESVVHFSLRYRAPLHIVKLLALRFPLCLTRPDCTGKFAIHVACKYGSLPTVVEYLVSENKHAASVQDPTGKTPIHYLAEYYASNYESPSHLVNENMMQIIRVLREVAPESFNIEDNEEMNAIEYGIENDLDLRVIKMMQRAARDNLRALRASSGKKHEELAKDIVSSTSETRIDSMNTLTDASRATVPFKSFVAKSA